MPVHKFDLDDLEVFVAVEATKSMTDAARALNLTTSAVSKRIASLEGKLGFRLFNRSSNGQSFSITEKGLQVLNRAGPIVKAVEELVELSRDLCAPSPKAVTGTLRLGTIVDPESIRLGELIYQLRDKYPLVQVSLEHGISGAVLDKLNSGDLDACFHLGGVAMSFAVESRLLREEQYDIVAPTTFAGDIDENTPWEALAELPWVDAPFGSSQHGMIESLLRERNLQHKVIIRADQEASMIELIRNKVAIGLMRRSLTVSALRSKRIIRVRSNVRPCALYVLYSPTSENPQVIAALKKVIELVWFGTHS